MRWSSEAFAGIRLTLCQVAFSLLAMPASLALATVGPTLGISCERSIRSTLVSFIPLFGGLGAS